MVDIVRSIPVRPKELLHAINLETEEDQALRVKISPYALECIEVTHFRFGSHEVKPYEKKALAGIGQAVAEQGEQFFVEHPVYCCPLFEKGRSRIALLDGHNRRRVARRYQIPAISALLFTTETISAIYQKQNGTPIEPSVVHNLLIEAVMASYGTDNTIVRRFPSVTTVAELLEVLNQTQGEAV